MTTGAHHLLSNKMPYTVWAKPLLSTASPSDEPYSFKNTLSTVLYIIYSTLPHTAYCAVCSIYHTASLYISCCMFYTPDCYTLYTVLYVLYTRLLHSVHWVVCSILHTSPHCAICSVLHTFHIVLCVLYSILLQSVHCAVHCTVNNFLNTVLCKLFSTLYHSTVCCMRYTSQFTLYTVFLIKDSMEPSITLVKAKGSMNSEQNSLTSHLMVSA